MESYNLKKYEPGTSLVVQWLRLQAPSVWSLVRELDSTCWNQEFKCFNRDGWSQVPQLRSWTVKCINKKNKKYEANICLMYQAYKVASKRTHEQILKVVKIVNKNSQLKYIYHFSTIILIKYYLKQYFAHQFSSIKLALFSILIINAGFDALKWASIFQQW